MGILESQKIGNGTQDFSFTAFKESLQFIVQDKLSWRPTDMSWKVKEEIWPADAN